MRFRLPTTFVTIALLVAAAPPARADTVTSSNWAGYAAHRAGIQFTRIAGAWTQPHASCTPGTPSYSAVWVGLGGYNETSNALEQIGSEVDCKASGRVVSTVWYELVPAGSRTIKLRVRPGDGLYARVAVNGTTVAVAITNTTTHRTFRKILHDANLDVSSAEWIVEAPSNCFSNSSCQTLPLADFGSTTFAFATARSAAGHTGTISDPAWDNSQIELSPGGRRFVNYNGSGSSIGIATPSGLAANGSAFRVTFSTVSPRATPRFATRASAARAGYLVHPGR